MSIAEKINAIAENVEKVFEAGQRSGGNDAFWEEFQQGGQRTAYGYAFVSWTDAMFTPRYDIKPAADGGSDMFYKTAITDLNGLLDARGKVLDTSQATKLDYAFNSALNLTSIPALDLKNCTSLKSTFKHPNRASQVEEITLNNLKSTCVFQDTFYGCTALTSLTITGTIGQNGFNVTECPLSKDSIGSILKALENKTGSGFTITLGDTNKGTLQDMMDSNGLPEGVTVTLENGAYKCKGWTLA